jgi:hypothetical protein
VRSQLKLLLCLLLSLGALAAPESVHAESVNYRVVYDDPTDMRIKYLLFPATAYAGRGLGIGAGGQLRLGIARRLAVHVGGNYPYLNLGEFGLRQITAEGILAIGLSIDDQNPSRVTVDVQEKSWSDGKTITTSTTTKTAEMPVTTTTKSTLRLGARLYDGPVDPNAPSEGSGGEAKRVPGTLLQATLGYYTELGGNWEVLVNEYGTKKDKGWFDFGIDLMWSLVATADEPFKEGYPLFPLGARFVMSAAPNRALGFGVNFEGGLNGHGAGWYAMLGLGIGGGVLDMAN